MKRLFTLLLISFVAMSCEMSDEMLDSLLGKDDSSVIAIPNNQIWYTSTDGNTVDHKSQIASNVVAKSIAKQGDYIVITFHDDVTEICNHAFDGCDRLESIILPNSLTAIGDNVFSGCSSLKEFKGKFASRDGRALIIDGVLKSFAPAGLTEYSIPSGVTKIGYATFSGCYNLTSITIPEGVTAIGDVAFTGCSSLTSITIPNSVTTIGGMAFTGCSSLASIDIPDGVTVIKEWVFSECSSLTRVTIPDSVTVIYDGAFCNCTSLQEFNGKFVSEDGRALIVEGVLKSFAPAGLTEYTISDSATMIGYMAFAYCGSLASVTIPDSVTYIEDLAFIGCSNLTSITIPEGVSIIGMGAFQSCSTLASVYCKPTTPPAGDEYMFNYNAANRVIYVPAESVEAYKSAYGWRDYAYAIMAEGSSPDDIPTSIIRYTTKDGMIVYPQNMNIKSNTYIDGEGVLEFYGDVIGNNAFFACDNLTSVTIGDSVTRIGDFAFNACVSIARVTLGEGVEHIGFKAFDDCTSITEITIPDSVKSIGVQAFCYCTGLSLFKGKFASEDGKCLIVDGKLIAIAIGCDDIGEYVIPDGVTEIANYSIYFCHSLSSVVIPDSVVRIGEGAFKDCRNLNSVTIGDKVESVGEFAFILCQNLTSVYCKAIVPPVAEDVYWDSWGAFDSNSLDRQIYVPTESVDAYKSAEGWNHYASAIVGYAF